MRKSTPELSKLFTALLISNFLSFSGYGIAEDSLITFAGNQEAYQSWNESTPYHSDGFCNNTQQSPSECVSEGDVCCSPAWDHQAFGECCNNGCCDVRSKYHDPTLYTIECCGGGGIWLPEDPVLFRPFMADPREICYSVGWRFNDNALTKNIIDVSFGDTLAIYRWCDVWPWHGQLQIDIEGAVWAVFDPATESAPLINADYYVGFPLTYAVNKWQFRLRPFHISSHIGDEFLLNHPGFDRRNASNEYIDFFVSHDLTPEIRFYAGIGYILRQDESFKIKPFYSAVGAELRLMHLGFYDAKDYLVGFPIFAMHFRQNGEYKKHADATYILGYQFSKLCGLCRNMRFFLEYHDGYSSEGQFCKDPTNYFAIRGSYGF